jgi:hypothetical protein
MQDKKTKNKTRAAGQPKGEWKGSWSRPMKVDPASLDPLTVARMTDHNVRGMDTEAPESAEKHEEPAAIKKAG